MILFISIFTGLALGYVLSTKLFLKSNSQIIAVSIITPIITWLIVTLIWAIIESKENIEIIFGKSLGNGILGYIALGIMLGNRQLNKIRLHNKEILKSEGEYKGNLKNGKWKYWNEDGDIIKEEDYYEGTLLRISIYEKPNKIMQSVYENGLLTSEGALINNKKEGKWKIFNNDSFLIKEEIYEDDKLMETIEYEYPNFT